MKLSVSSRIAEGFLSKEEAIMTLPEFCDLAVGAGYKSICMRASQIGIQTPAEEVARGARLIQDKGLEVTMISGDFDIVYNNMQGPRCLHNISPYLDLAEQLGAKLIRICIKTEDDIQAATTDDISTKGALIHMEHPLPVGALFDVVLRFPGNLFASTLQAKVVWQRKEAPSGVGVQFIYGSKRQQVQMEKLINQLKTKMLAQQQVRIPRLSP